MHDLITYHKKEIAPAKIGATHYNAYLELLDKVREKGHKHDLVQIYTEITHKSIYRVVSLSLVT